MRGARSDTGRIPPAPLRAPRAGRFARGKGSPVARRPGPEGAGRDTRDACKSGRRDGERIWKWPATSCARQRRPVGLASSAGRACATVHRARVPWRHSPRRSPPPPGPAGAASDVRRACGSAGALPRASSRVATHVARTSKPADSRIGGRFHRLPHSGKLPPSLFAAPTAAMAAPSAALSVSVCMFHSSHIQLNTNYEDSKGGGGFLAGFLIGGAIFGTLGYVFAPQISRTLDSLLDENGQDSESDETGLQRVPGPQRGQYYDEGLEKTRQTLGDKISQLNLAIDKAASRLKRVTGNVENEAVVDETEIEISSLNDNEHVVENLNEHGFVQGESATRTSDSTCKLEN
ncbi:uncharacterized protein C2845_PM16G18270 [Panicum miliaceum]|uniref:Uncharacterized protein n=1 Tax=Panicum miliaceum TaxID=4540 RepID=A0A3L6PRI0_PANMI|nr:uncharacterized protein C2845_PM16G18270 [Panicum miliaceum]